MSISRRTLLTSAFAATLLPAREALALKGEPFPVFESEAKDIPYKFRRREVEFETAEPAGTLVVDAAQRFLYRVQGGGKAMRYGAPVGKAAESQLLWVAKHCHFLPPRADPRRGSGV